MERGLGKGWGRVGERVGEGLGKGWGRVGEGVGEGFPKGWGGFPQGLGRVWLSILQQPCLKYPINIPYREYQKYPKYDSIFVFGGTPRDICVPPYGVDPPQWRMVTWGEIIHPQVFLAELACIN